MIKLITNYWLVVCVGLTAIAVSVGASFLYCDWTWFGRSGSLLTLSGATLAVRPLLRLGPAEFYRDQNDIDGGSFVPTPEEIEAERQGLLDVQAAHTGFWFILIGSLIWGYGDLVQFLLK